jgi:DNA-binding response OmpR family regulator
MTDGQVNTPEGEARRALVLYNRPLVVDLITLTLHHGGLVVRAASNLAEAEAILADWPPDLTVIDMDHDDSTALLRLLEASTTMKRSGTPVLGLTRRGDLKTKLRAFDLGVDDIDLPLIPVIRLGEIEIDILNRVVRAGDSVIHMSGIEQSLLYLLASRGGRVVTKEEILDAIWGTDFVAESNIVDRHVRSLRIKLQDDWRQPRFIATVPGQGYRFIPTFSNTGWDGGRDPSEQPTR